MPSEQDFLESLGSLEHFSDQQINDLLNLCSTSNTSFETILHGACRKIGLIVGECKQRTANHWMSFLSDMNFRKRQMWTSECFQESAFSSNAEVVHYHRGMIVLAPSNMQLSIWDIQKNTCLKEFSLPGWSATSVKLGDSFLVAVSDRGHIAWWDLAKPRNVFQYEHPKPSAVSYDFLEVKTSMKNIDYHILVAGFEDRCLKAWDMSKRVELWSVTDLREPVENVSLAPKTTHDKEFTFWLFWKDKNCIHVREVSFKSERQKIHPFRGWTIIKTISIITLHASECATMVANTSIFFHENFLYFLIKEVNIIYKYNPEIPSTLFQFNISPKVKTILGVGKKYIAFIGTKKDEKNLRFFAVNNETGDIAIEYKLPVGLSSSAFANHNPVCLGDADWLDGLDGSNDKGALFVCARGWDPPYVLKWKPRRDGIIPECFVEFS